MKFGNLFMGVSILAKYQDPEGDVVCAVHDKLMCCWAALPLTPDDKAEMERLGWFVDEESWACWT